MSMSSIETKQELLRLGGITDEDIRDVIGILGLDALSDEAITHITQKKLNQNKRETDQFFACILDL